jgi:hypothetical protein
LEEWVDAFEQVVSEILWMEGHWVRTSVKVKLTAQDRIQIGLPSCPRWEIDIVAYKPANGLLHVVECKSYFDSAGVRACAFDGSKPDVAERYKLFNRTELRDVVLNRLGLQLLEAGLCRQVPQMRLALACGKIKNEADRTRIRDHFRARRWELWDERWLRERLERMAHQGYENQAWAVVAKLLLR